MIGRYTKVLLFYMSLYVYGYVLTKVNTMPQLLGQASTKYLYM